MRGGEQTALVAHTIGVEVYIDMDLRNGNITIAEILAYPPAKAILMREFPAMMNHPMLHMAGRFTLNTAISMAGDALPMQKRKEILEKLKAL